MFPTIRVIVALFVLASPTHAEQAAIAQSGDSAASDAVVRWWPVQKVPQGYVRLEEKSSPHDLASWAMTAQSVSGLAAKAVNAGRSDELVWIDTGVADVRMAFERRLRERPELEMRGTFNLWELVDRYAKLGIVKGYILYRADKSEGQLNDHRSQMDCSVNVATSLAGVLDGIIVEESLEDEAKAAGLKLLADARDKSQEWCFENYRDQFNRRIVCTQDPKKSHVRDFAIAQQAITIYGDTAPTPQVMEWLEPLSPVLGWNGGDEFKTTELSSRWGQIQTATDWCTNLPFLMAGTESAQQPMVPDFDPNTIDWKDQRSAVSFVCTDGDNVQWYQGGVLSSESYWGNKDRGKIPFGWSCCFSQLAQLCPEITQYAVETRKPNDSFIEWGGGYYYPDLFATNRSDRWLLLAEQARRTWALMKQNKTRIIGLNVADYDSPDARRAYEVIARETDGLLAILIFQYSRYEEGAGDTFWVRDRNGLEVPVITARYSIWANESRDRAGTPAKVAREIRQTVANTPPSDLPRYDWAMCHVWSYFKKAPGVNEKAENMSQDSAAIKGGERGYSPAVWCAERLPANIRAVSPEELAWRVRMQRNPVATQELLRRDR